MNAWIDTLPQPWHEVPALAAALRAGGHDAVLVLDVAGPDGRLHWLDTPQARGWVRPGVGEGAPDPAEVRQAWAQARADGHCAADALLVACVRGSGVDRPADGAALPQLTWDETIRFASARPLPAGPLGLYAIVDSAMRLRQVLDAGVGTVQLRIKRPADAGPAWQAALRAQLAQALADARAAGALLFVNDHWGLAGELGAAGVHLGQEDLQALGADGRAALLASGVALGISSHSLWELCRARSLAPRYIACGPVWPTTTKDMPWRPQGEHNLRWWSRVAGAPVTAIGGILAPGQARDVAAWGADGVCLVRALGDDPAAAVPAYRAAVAQGHAARDGQAPDWLRPVLP